MHIAEIIQSLTLTQFFFAELFILAMTGACIFAGMKAGRVARAIAETKVSKISEALPGYIALEAKVEDLPGQAIKAPLTDWACCWYRAKIEKWERDPARSSSDTRSSDWHTVDELTSTVPLLCRDGGGVCAILPRGASVTYTDKSVWYGDSPKPENRNPERYAAGEAAEGALRISGTPGRKFRYTEERIYKGDSIFALGHFENDPEVEDEEDPELEGVRAATPNRLVRPSEPGQPFIISAVSRRTLMEMNQMGSKAAYSIAALPAAVAALLLWIRFF